MALPSSVHQRIYEKFVELGTKVAIRVGVFNSSGTQVDTFGADPVGIKDTASTPIDPATKERQQPPVTTTTEYNITLTSADTEYSQALPTNTREYRFRCRTLYDVRYSFTTGKVATPTAPYFTLPAGSDYVSDNDNLSSKTLYLASSEAGVVVELQCWT